MVKLIWNLKQNLTQIKMQSIIIRGTDMLPPISEKQKQMHKNTAWHLAPVTALLPTPTSQLTPLPGPHTKFNSIQFNKVHFLISTISKANSD